MQASGMRIVEGRHDAGGWGWLRRWPAIALAAGLLALQAGCFKMAVPEEKPVTPLLWPAPPEVPRISYVGAISRPADIGIREGLVQGFMRYLAGRPETPLVNPHGLTVDGEGRVYVVDNYRKKVHVYDPGRSNYRLFPQQGEPLVSPIGIAVDERRGRVYVTDSAAAVVRVFALDDASPAGEIRRGDMGRPTGIAVNPHTDELLVVDTLHSGILRFALPDHGLKGIIGQEGREAGRFHSPTHIAISPEGNIHVTDSLNFRVQVFSPEGRFIRAFGAAGDSPGYFSRPKGIAVDGDGNSYVVDALFDNVQVFDTAGRLLMSFGTPGTGPGQFWLPSGIFIDRNNRVFVSDSYNKRVQVFQYLKEGELP